ncbi:MAG: hypothetical protein Fur0016_06920 [Anaerolineales bacterium]
MSTPENAKPEQAAKAFTALQKANLRVFSFTMMLAGWALLIFYAGGFLITGNTRYTGLIATEATISIILTIAWLLQRQGKHTLAAWIIPIAVISSVIVFNQQVAGLGLALSIIISLILAMAAWQILPARSAALGTLLIAASGVLMYVTDASSAQADRISGGFFLSTLLVIVGGLIIFILAINGLRGVEFTSIASQLRIYFLVVSLIPVLIITIFQTVTLVNVLITQASNTLLANADALASELDSQLFSIVTLIEEDAENTQIINYLRNPDQNSSLLTLLAARYPNAISYGLLDKNGFLISDNRGNAGDNESDNLYFRNAAAVRITYISDVVLDEDTRKSVFFVSKPVLDKQGNFLGVIRIKFSAGFFQQIAEESARQLSQDISVIVLDDANIILAHSADPALVSKTLSIPGRVTIAGLQQSGRLPLSGKISANLDELDRILKRTEARTVFTSSILPAEIEQNYITFTPIKYKPWKILVAQRATVFLAPATNQAILIALIIIVLFAAIYLGANLTAMLLVTPMKRLTFAAQELSAGKLDIPIHLPRKDELGTLATVLNNTRQQVYELLQTLEQRVEERTAELMRANEKNERRAMQLETIAQVAHAVTSLRDLNELLPEITRQISASFGYYHAGIFLLDENREYAVLRAANSQGGQAMLARGHRIKVGRQGIVGNVTNTGRYRIALDVGDDAVFFNNPDLPQTRSEAALPLLIGENIIGALDVQSTEPNAFSEDDIKALSLLSDQISVAIENARLFDETRQALAQIQEIYAESSATGWQSMVKETSTSGYRYARGSVEPLRKNPETAATLAGETLEIPIMLRGEKLGDLKIRRPSRQAAWNETEARMYQSIAERMSFALENARLFSDARRRANLERVVAEAATKISSSVRVETILRTAAEEISHLIDGSEVLIQIQPGAIEKIDSKSSSAE